MKLAPADWQPLTERYRLKSARSSATLICSGSGLRNAVCSPQSRQETNGPDAGKGMNARWQLVFTRYDFSWIQLIAYRYISLEPITPASPSERLVRDGPTGVNTTPATSNA